jgi:hypothetical protein
MGIVSSLRSKQKRKLEGGQKDPKAQAESDGWNLTMLIRVLYSAEPLITVSARQMGFHQV